MEWIDMEKTTIDLEKIKVIVAENRVIDNPDIQTAINRLRSARSGIERRWHSWRLDHMPRQVESARYYARYYWLNDLTKDEGLIICWMLRDRHERVIDAARRHGLYDEPSSPVQQTPNRSLWNSLRKLLRLNKRHE